MYQLVEAPARLLVAEDDRSERRAIETAPRIETSISGNSLPASGLALYTLAPASFVIR